MVKLLPSRDELLERFLYDAEEGKLIWRSLPDAPNTRAFNGKLAGKEAGTPNGSYKVIKIDGVPYFAHRLIWKIETGTDPDLSVDHIDGNGQNNRRSNLRLATSVQNSWNAKLKVNNTSGFKGVSFNRRCGKWKASLKVRDRDAYLGLFESAEAAHEAVSRAAREHRGEFARAV